MNRGAPTAQSELHFGALVWAPCDAGGRAGPIRRHDVISCASEVLVNRFFVVLVLMLVLISRVAIAGTPVLAPFKGTDATVSFPKGWMVRQDGGIYVAQQDPKRKDSAGMLFIYMPNSSNATEDQLLDGLTAKVVQDLKVGDRAAINGGVGHYLIADGTSDGTKVRVAALAVVMKGQAIVSVLISKGSDFDALGGILLATQVMASLQPSAPPVAPPTPSSNGITNPNTMTNQQVTNGGRLTVPPPARPITVADMAGDWSQDDHVMSNYVSASTVSYAGYSAIATSEKWSIDGKGNIASKLRATSSSSRQGTYQVAENMVGTISITADGDLLIMKNTGVRKTHYQIRGWEVRPDITVIKVNGPYYDEGIPDRIKADPHYAWNLDKYWVRKATTR
jgi:hypothetical protein